MFLLNTTLHKILVCSPSWPVNASLIKHINAIESFSLTLASVSSCCLDGEVSLTVLVTECALVSDSAVSEASGEVPFSEPTDSDSYVATKRQRIRSSLWIKHLLNAGQWYIRVPSGVIWHLGTLFYCATSSLGTFLWICSPVFTIGHCSDWDFEISFIIGS